MAGAKDLDRVDRAILRALARDASLSLADIAERVGLTPTPCWKRIRRMEQEGVIRGRVAVLDPEKIGLPVSVFVAVETSDHSSGWLERFASVVAGMEEIVDAWRMSGDVDYLLHVMVADIAAYNSVLSPADRCGAAAERHQPLRNGADEVGAAAGVIKRRPGTSSECPPSQPAHAAVQPAIPHAAAAGPQRAWAS